MALEGNRPNPCGNPGFWWRPSCYICQESMHEYSQTDKVAIRAKDGEIVHEFTCKECRAKAEIGFFLECPPCKAEIKEGRCCKCKIRYSSLSESRQVTIPDWELGIYGIS